MLSAVSCLSSFDISPSRSALIMFFSACVRWSKVSNCQSRNEASTPRYSRSESASIISLRLNSRSSTSSKLSDICFSPSTRSDSWPMRVNSRPLDRSVFASLNSDLATFSAVASRSSRICTSSKRAMTSPFLISENSGAIHEILKAIRIDPGKAIGSDSDATSSPWARTFSSVSTSETTTAGTSVPTPWQPLRISTAAIAVNVVLPVLVTALPHRRLRDLFQRCACRRSHAPML